MNANAEKHKFYKKSVGICSSQFLLTSRVLPAHQGKTDLQDIFGFTCIDILIIIIVIAIFIICITVMITITVYCYFSSIWVILTIWAIIITMIIVIFSSYSNHSLFILLFSTIFIVPHSTTVSDVFCDDSVYQSVHDYATFCERVRGWSLIFCLSVPSIFTQPRWVSRIDSDFLVWLITVAFWSYVQDDPFFHWPQLVLFAQFSVDLTFLNLFLLSCWWNWLTIYGFIPTFFSLHT